MKQAQEAPTQQAEAEVKQIAKPVFVGHLVGQSVPNCLGLLQVRRSEVNGDGHGSYWYEKHGKRHMEFVTLNPETHEFESAIV